MRFIANLWRWFAAPTRRFGWGPLFVAGGMAGIVFWGGFNTYMEYTNSLEFCVSCHEMRDFVYEEYKTSPHYRNASGVRAVCADCHVPREWTPKLLRKIRASNELYHKLTGSIDSREKFEARRLELAERVWAEMEANDSRECRNCHSYDAMHFDKQERRAADKMRDAVRQGKTCIECHKFIAHKRPADYEDDDD